MYTGGGAHATAAADPTSDPFRTQYTVRPEPLPRVEARQREAAAAVKARIGERLVLSWSDQPTWASATVEEVVAPFRWVAHGIRPPPNPRLRREQRCVFEVPP